MTVKEVTIKVTRTIQVSQYSPLTVEVSKVCYGESITDKEVIDATDKLALLVDTQIHEYIKNNYSA